VYVAATSVERVEGGCDERVPGAGGQEDVHVAGGTGAGDWSEGEAPERLGKELWGERDGETSGDEGANGELVAGDRHEVGLKAGSAAGADDQPVRRGGAPVVVAEVREVHVRQSGQAVVGRQRDHERLAQEVAAFAAGWLVPWFCGVLKAHCEMQVTGSDASRQVVRSLVNGDLRAGVSLA